MHSATALPSTQPPPPTPLYILRGHTSPIHTLRFLRRNSRLLSGDADGWVVLWAISTKRPVAVWRAHETTVLGAEPWGPDRLITHGRDGRICVWQLGSPADETPLSTRLPADDDPAAHRPAPWLLHVLRVSAVNFCAFASCVAPPQTRQKPPQPPPPPLPVAREVGTWNGDVSGGEDTSRSSNNDPEAEGARPAEGEEDDVEGEAKAESEGEGEPSQDTLILAVAGAQDAEIALYALPSERRIGVIPAPPSDTDETAGSGAAGKAGMVMALRVFRRREPGQRPERRDPGGDVAVVLAGYESGRVCAFEQVAGAGAWRVVYSARTHGQPVLGLDVAGCGVFYSSGADAIVARHVLPPLRREDDDGGGMVREEGVPGPGGKGKVVRTGHSGQQGLVVRSDGRVLATAGWDGRVRVYAGGTLRELAVLRWHRVGCYAVAFAEVEARAVEEGRVDRDIASEVAATTTALVGRGVVEVGRSTVGQARDAKAQSTHWLAAGSKDGKVSLWDIY